MNVCVVCPHFVPAVKGCVQSHVASPPILFWLHLLERQSVDISLLFGATVHHKSGLLEYNHDLYGLS